MKRNPLFIGILSLCMLCIFRPSQVLADSSLASSEDKQRFHSTRFITSMGVYAQKWKGKHAPNYRLHNRQGVFVERVLKGSSADRAGLKVGDVITSLNGVEMHDPRRLKDALASFSFGEKVKLGIIRGEKEKVKKLKLALHQQEHAHQHQDHAQAYLGIYYKTARDGGVYVRRVVPHSAAAEAGLRKGDVILELNKATLRNGEELKYQLAHYKPGKKVKILYMREGHLLKRKTKLTQKYEY